MSWHRGMIVRDKRTGEEGWLYGYDGCTDKVRLEAKIILVMFPKEGLKALYVEDVDATQLVD